MNFKPILCWEAAWYDICHNTHSHTHACVCRETERAGQQVCFLLQLIKSILLSEYFLPCCLSFSLQIMHLLFFWPSSFFSPCLVFCQAYPPYSKPYLLFYSSLPSFPFCHCVSVLLHLCQVPFPHYCYSSFNWPFFLLFPCPPISIFPACSYFIILFPFFPSSSIFLLLLHSFLFSYFSSFPVYILFRPLWL